jgi:DNA repair protein RadC
MTKNAKQTKVYEKAIKNWPVDDRPREKLLKKGARALSNSELLAILLRTGTSGTSAIYLARKLATLEKIMMLNSKLFLMQFEH